MRTKVFRLAVVGGSAALLLAAPVTSFANHVVVKATARDRWYEDYNHIVPGTRVVWKNPARLNSTHDVTAYGRNWDKQVTLRAGDSTAKRFRNTGTYKYRCRIHSQLNNGQCDGMCGVIHVDRY